MTRIDLFTETNPKMRIHSVLRKNSNLIATVLRSRRHEGITRTLGSNNGSSRLISFSNTRTQPVYQEQRLLYETELPHLSSWNDKTSLKDEASRKEIVSFFPDIVRILSHPLK